MDRQADFPFVSGQLTRLLTDLGVAAKIVNQQVNRAGLTSILGASGATNIQDERQQKLDVFADDTFMRASSLLARAFVASGRKNKSTLSDVERMVRAVKSNTSS